MNKANRFETSMERLSGPDELNPEERALWQAAQQATETSYAPYSGFYVGAAVLLEDGTMVRGSNQENASYPQGLCAERVAIFSAGSQHSEKSILAVAIAARDSKTGQLCAVSPCGGCRQVMLEFEQKQDRPIRVLFPGKDHEILVSASVQILLPFGFKSPNSWQK